MPDTPTVATVHPTGTRVRVIRSSGDAREGEELTLEDYVSAEEAEDPTGVAFYWASTEQGVNDRWVEAGAIEVIQTAKEAAARRPPTREEVAEGLNGLLTDHDVFDCDEIERDGDTLMLYGKTPDGLRVAVELQVQSVVQVDF